MQVLEAVTVFWHFLLHSLHGRSGWRWPCSSSQSGGPIGRHDSSCRAHFSLSGPERVFPARTHRTL